MRGSSGGPCCHCGTSQTPCWRKGPPEKPTLCNACGSRYLVKGSLAGYFPGARRSSASTARSDAPQIHHTVVVTKGPRKAALPASTGVKRKARNVEGCEGQPQCIFNDYDALEALRYSLFYRGPAFFGQTNAVVATASDSSGEGQQEEDCFRKESHYLDASSDEYQEPGHEGPSLRHALAATTATGIAEPQPVMFHRRPRKQLKPVACSC